MTQPPFNPGFRQMFAENQLTLGVFFAIEAYKGSIPTMQNQVRWPNALKHWALRHCGCGMCHCMIPALAMWGRFMTRGCIWAISPPKLAILPWRREARSCRKSIPSI